MSAYLEIVSFFLHQNLLILSVLSILTAFLFSYAIIPTIVYVSVIKNLTANPNERSSHIKKTPNLGGVGIAFGSFFSYAFFGSFVLSSSDLSVLLSITSSLVILFAVGLKDDLVGISPSLKLFAEILAALIFIIISGLRIDSFYGIFGVYELNEVVSTVFTVFVFVLITNSINLIDGIDGLAASVSLVIFISLLFYFVESDFVLGVLFSASIIGGLSAFLRFNVSKGMRKIFMGDVGSLLVGFTLAVLSTMTLSTSLKSSDLFTNKPVFILALFAFPFLDTLRVFFLRGIAGNSPFKADKNHLHHKLLNYGYTHLQSTLIIIGYCFLVLITSIVFYDTLILKHLFFTLTVSVIILIVLLFFLSRIKKLNK